MATYLLSIKFLYSLGYEVTSNLFVQNLLYVIKIAIDVADNGKKGADMGYMHFSYSYH